MTSGSILAALTPHLSEPSPVIELPGLWTGSTLGAALLSVAGPVLNGSSVSLGLWETDLGGKSEGSRICGRGWGVGGVQSWHAVLGCRGVGHAEMRLRGGAGVQSREEQN